ncbi:MAG: DHHA1 domain-containing protein [bacterium]|nr:DHHA1 domain-containing protein [bacterium]
MKKIVILYHADCPDGFGGAWSAWKKFGNKADYIPAQHQEPPPKGLKNKEIYMIDFTYPLSILKQMTTTNRRITAIDHHASAEAETKSTYKPLYSINNSGAVLAWKYFHPKKSIPKMLSYVEDIDLFRFQLKNSKEIRSYMTILPRDFQIWKKTAADFQNIKKLKEILKTALALLQYETKLVRDTAENYAEMVNFLGYKAYAINSPNFDSQLGEYLYKKLPPMAIIWSKRNGYIKVSLRSDRTVDVAKLAKKFGGGGHMGASGFKLPGNAKLPWTPLKIKNPKW